MELYNAQRFLSVTRHKNNLPTIKDINNTINTNDHMAHYLILGLSIYKTY